MAAKIGITKTGYVGMDGWGDGCAGDGLAFMIMLGVMKWVIVTGGMLNWVQVVWLDGPSVKIGGVRLGNWCSGFMLVQLVRVNVFSSFLKRTHAWHRSNWLKGLV